jgi:Bacterial Ig-like domain (group 1)
MKMFKFLGVTLAATLLIAGCSGGGHTLTQSTSTGGGGATAAKVNVTSSSATISADGSATATITAVAVDANNVAVANAAVTFGASAGLLQGASTTTDTTGTAAATLSAGGAAAGTAITVTVTIGGATGSTVVNVVANQQTMSLTTDSPQIPSDGSKAATISAVLRDANNVALSGVTVNFAVTSGTLTPTQPVTDATGTAKATLTALPDPSDRTITVTGTAASAQPGTVPVVVEGTTLSVSGPAALVLNGTGSYQVVLKDSAGHGIAGVAVTVTSANGNGITASSPLTTDANGQAPFVLTAKSAANNGVDKVSASALGLIASQTVTVSSQNFSITTPATSPANVNLNTPQNIAVTWLNNGAPVANGTMVTFSSTRGTLSATSAAIGAAYGSPPVAGTAGVAGVSISSTTSGPAVVTASATGVSAQTTIDFIATTASQISVQAAPASIATQGQSTITATVRDAQNNPVQGQTVTFTLTNDTTGGQLASSAAMTDAQGIATTVYTAGATTSGANGVTITAAVQGTSVSGPVTLTVGGQAVFLSLGTGNSINSPDQATYSITYAVLALDAQGAAVANAPITLKVLPVSYVKGNRQWNVNTWATVPSTSGSDTYATPPGAKTCANEDTDYTGNIASLDSGSPANCTNLVTNQSIPSHFKDYNCSGALDPGNVAAVSPASGMTDANGKLLVTVSYPKDHAYYVTVQLVASTNVAGTQSSTSSTFDLPGAAIDFNSQNTGPPGPASPYGQATTCVDPR